MPALVIVSLRQIAFWPLTVLWAGVFLITGGVLGFLFGVPSAKPPTGSGVDVAIHQAQTNLQQISDWLTKIMIGVAMINIRQFPEQLGQLAKYVAAGLRGPADEPFVMALIIYFVLAGVVIGFFGCRVYFRIAATEGGAAAIAEFTETLESTLARKVESALRGPVMVNYEGYLCLSIQQSGRQLNLDESAVILKSFSGELNVQAWVQRDAPPNSVASAPVSIRDGDDRDTADFEIRLDSDDFRTSDSTRRVTTSRQGETPRAAFTAKFDIDTPESSSAGDDAEDDAPALQHPLWLMLFQQNRLVQTITLDCKVG